MEKDPLEEAFRNAFDGFEEAYMPFEAIHAKLRPVPMPLWKRALRVAAAALPLLFCLMADRAIQYEEGEPTNASSSKSAALPDHAAPTPKRQSAAPQQAEMRASDHTAQRSNKHAAQQQELAALPRIQNVEPADVLPVESINEAHYIKGLGAIRLSFDMPKAGMSQPNGITIAKTRAPLNNKKIQWILMLGATYTQARLHPNTEEGWSMTASNAPSVSIKNMGFQFSIGAEKDISDKLSIEGVLTYNFLNKAVDAQAHRHKPSHYETIADSLGGYSVKPVFASPLHAKMRMQPQLLGWRIGFSHQMSSALKVAIGAGQEVLLHNHHTGNLPVGKSPNLNHLLYAGLQWEVARSEKLGLAIVPQFGYYFSNTLANNALMKAKPCTFSVLARVEI